MVCSGQNGRNNGGDISGFPFSPKDLFDGRPWYPQPGQLSPRRQLVYFISVLGQFYSISNFKGSLLSPIFRKKNPSKRTGSWFPFLTINDLLFIKGQIFNETEKLGGKLSGIGDLVEELQDATNEDSDEDIIDSFALFLQVDFTFNNRFQGKFVFGSMCYFDIYHFHDNLFGFITKTFSSSNTISLV